MGSFTDGRDLVQEFKETYKSHPTLVSILVVVVAMLFLYWSSFLFDGTGNEPAAPQTVASVQPSTQTVSNEQAKQELSELITLLQQARLVTSYEFSDSANVVYVTDVWFTQDVTFKRDFLAKISMLKHAITGYKRFQVRHANSNEMLGEVTGFSGSLEVYR